MKRLLMAVLVAALVGAASPSQVAANGDDVIRFTVDVAEDFTRFVPTPVNPGDTMPARGSWFLTEGIILKGGTIPDNGASFDPAAYKSKALGTWHCRGTHLTPGAEVGPDSHPWVTTNQIFLFADDKRMLTTDGLEGSQPVLRVVTGGTGIFRGYVGEQHQRFLGFNATNGVNLRITFTLRRAAH